MLKARSPPFPFFEKKSEKGGKYMNDFNKYNFFSKIDEETKERKFYIKLDGKMIEVPKDVYYVCFNSYRKELRDHRKDEQYGLISLDEPVKENYTLMETLGTFDDPLDTILHKDELMNVYKAINSLSQDERNLIIDLLINDKKERELAIKYHIAQQTINKKKKAILKKIKKILDEGV